jgi:hypothetical protein
MKRFSNSRRELLVALATTALFAGASAAAPPAVDEGQLLDAGFKTLAPTNKVQEDWVRRLAPGKFRAMQRTGKKFYIYPAASKKQIYVGGPNEYEAYVKLHPEHRAADPAQAAKQASAYRQKQEQVMRDATGRDLSDPFLGVSWSDLGW